MQHAKKPSSIFAAVILSLVGAALGVAQTVSPERVEEVAKRGAHVMPLDLKQTTHIFTKTEKGGLQQVIAKDPTNTQQIELIRQHLTKISREFSHGDFSDPAKIHGEDMPGLAELRTAKASQLRVEYKELENGAEIDYSSDDPALIEVVNKWFDAQLAEHGPDAMPGHRHDAMHKIHKPN